MYVVSGTVIEGGTATIQRGLAHHEAGRLGEAVAEYRRVLEAAPGRENVAKFGKFVRHQVTAVTDRLGANPYNRGHSGVPIHSTAHANFTAGVLSRSVLRL